MRTLKKKERNKSTDKSLLFEEINRLYKDILIPFLDELYYSVNKAEYYDRIDDFTDELSLKIQCDYNTIEEFISCLVELIHKYKLTEIDSFAELLYYHITDKSDDIDTYFKNLTKSSESIYRNIHREYVISQQGVLEVDDWIKWYNYNDNLIIGNKTQWRRMK